MKKVVFIFFVWLVSIFIINKISASIIPDRTSYELPYKVPFTFSLAPLLNMDGRHYLDIACKGYFAKGGFDLRVFFPVYPLLIKALSFNCSINPVFIGPAVSLGSLLGLLYMLTRLVEKKMILKTVLLLLFFPTAFFFTAYYTESLFLLLTLIFFWFLRKKNYLAAAAFAALASGTRLLGIALLPVFLYEVFKESKKSRKLRLDFLLAPMGLVLFSFYNWISTGNPLTFLTNQTYWNRPLGITAPIFGLYKQITNILAGPVASYDSPFVYPMILVEFVMLVFMLAILYLSYKKIKMLYWIYMFASLVIILFAGPSSFPRYALVLFPAYIFLAERLKGVKYGVYLVCSFVLFVFMASLFLRGYWAS